MATEGFKKVHVSESGHAAVATGCGNRLGR